jgi:eukaryotic-like serine/threonine-protein kinase
MSECALQVVSDDYTGTTLGPYRVHECIGDGGMGRVYRAEHVDLRRPVAIKFLLPRYAADPETVSRFLQEARAVNMVRHANLVDIYDVFEDPARGIRAYVMELLNGRSLRDAMMEKPLELGAILAIARQIASALHAVHQVGVVHRDLKPENVYLCPGVGGDVVKVLDFGIAKFTRGDAPYRTRVGTPMGSPWYMAPEQATGKKVDERSDVYALGVLLYELLTGTVPFPSDNFPGVLLGHISEPPPPMRRHDGWEPPAALGAAVLRFLEKDPAARPADMAAAWRDLANAAGPEIGAPPDLVPPSEAAAAPAEKPPRLVPAVKRFPSPSRRPFWRMAMLGFALGLAGTLAGLAVLAAPVREPRAVARKHTRAPNRKHFTVHGTAQPAASMVARAPDPAPKHPAAKAKRPKAVIARKRARAAPSRATVAGSGSEVARSETSREVRP